MRLFLSTAYFKIYWNCKERLHIDQILEIEERKVIDLSVTDCGQITAISRRDKV